MIGTCDDYVLLQYSNYLEPWKFDESNEDLTNKLNGDYLTILRSLRKLLLLKSKNDLHIVCSSIGSEINNGSNQRTLWLAYSDINVIHIYKVEISFKNLLQPAISKINSLPLACGNRPAILIKFFPANNQLRLCYLTNKSYLQTLKLERDQTGFMLESTVQCTQQGMK